MEGHERALGGIRVVFREQEHGTESATTSFSHGEFDLMGLRPGTGWAFIENDQLQQLHVRSQPVMVTVGSAAATPIIEGIDLRIEFAGAR
ncbi:MAG: hypothetical protein ABSB58_05205 [Gemmatimonadales bacterium]